MSVFTMICIHQKVNGGFNSSIGYIRKIPAIVNAIFKMWVPLLLCVEHFSIIEVLGHCVSTF